MNDIFKCLKKMHAFSTEGSKPEFNYQGFYAGFCRSGDLSSHQFEDSTTISINSIFIKDNNKPIQGIGQEDKKAMESFDSNRSEIKCKFCPCSAIIGIDRVNLEPERYCIHKELPSVNAAKNNYKLTKELFANSRSFETLLYFRSYAEIAQATPPDLQDEFKSMNSPQTLWEKILWLASLSIDAKQSQKALLEYRRFYTLSKEEFQSIFSSTHNFSDNHNDKNNDKNNKEALFYAVKAIDSAVNFCDSGIAGDSTIEPIINNNIAKSIMLFYSTTNYHWVFIASLLRFVLYKITA